MTDQDHGSAGIPRSGRVLGLDWGTSRIGVAITDATQLIATPLTTLRRRAGKRLPLRAFLEIVEKEEPVGLVVGLPFDELGIEGASADAARTMGDHFADRSGLPIEWIDESFSTVDAQHALRDAGRTRAERAADIDAASAAVTLTRWIEMRRAESHQ
ncbi:MAG: Holliday junction resolvase RuvX [Gemmatimonadales bacterium]|nr:Holliday junction resolvase RuvX [Gemmatimonadales bacterium]